MAELVIDPIAHIYRRAGFGPSRQELLEGRRQGFRVVSSRSRPGYLIACPIVSLVVRGDSWAAIC